MRVLGEKIENQFVVAAFVHEIVQDHCTSLGNPCLDFTFVLNILVKLDSLLFHFILSRLSGPIVVVKEIRFLVEDIYVAAR